MEFYKITMHADTEELGTYNRHIQVSDGEVVKEMAEHRFVGNFVGAEKAIDFYDDKLMVNQMEYGKPYCITSYYSETSDYQRYIKLENIIFCSIFGSDFGEEGYHFYFGLSIAKEFDFLKNVDPEQFTLRHLEEIELEVYQNYLIEKKNHQLVGYLHYDECLSVSSFQTKDEQRTTQICKLINKLDVPF